MTATPKVKTLPDGTRVQVTLTENGAPVDEWVGNKKCSTCRRPAAARYSNRHAGERCVDACHDPYLTSSTERAAAKKARREIAKRRGT